ncbi:MAG: hypothetical protein IPM29_27270 [Planctomycetes bacterium]|nr:hypothetical protein [Planctomycetota bacterium]
MEARRNADGSWGGPDDAVGTTGLVLLAFTIDESTCSSGPFEDAVRAGVLALLRRLRADGAFTDPPVDLQQHALATAALVHAVGGAYRVVRPREFVQRAVDRLAHEVRAAPDPAHVAIGLETLSTARELSFAVEPDLLIETRDRLLAAVQPAAPAPHDAAALFASMLATRASDRRWQWLDARLREREPNLAALREPRLDGDPWVQWYAGRIAARSGDDAWWSAWRDALKKIAEASPTAGEVAATALSTLLIETHYLRLHRRYQSASDENPFAPPPAPVWDARGDELAALGELAKDPDGADGAHARAELLEAAGSETFRMRAWATMQLPVHPDVVPRLLELLPEALAAAAGAGDVAGREAAAVDQRRFAGVWFRALLSGLGAHRDPSVEPALLAVVQAAEHPSAIRIDTAKVLLQICSADGVRAVIRLRRAWEGAGASSERDVQAVDELLREAFVARSVELPAPPPADAATWFRLLGRNLEHFSAR